MGEVTIKALDNTSFSIEKGELVVIVGPSGAGKTTCLNILGGMDSVTSGKVIVDGKEVNMIICGGIIKVSNTNFKIFKFLNKIYPIHIDYINI